MYLSYREVKLGWKLLTRNLHFQPLFTKLLLSVAEKVHFIHTVKKVVIRHHKSLNNSEMRGLRTKW